MARTKIKFRGEDVEVEYKDHGYESDTNAHVIDWEFVDYAGGELTEAEEQAVYEQLVQNSYDHYDD